MMNITPKMFENFDLKAITFATCSWLFMMKLGLSQTNLTNDYHNYTIEVPKGFTAVDGYNKNVSFKAVSGEASIVIVVKNLPTELMNYNLSEIVGDLDLYMEEWENGANEYFNQPNLVKYGDTIIDNVEAIWYDYTSESPLLYSKTYQTKYRNYLYTITLTCPKEKQNYYSNVWFRFKDSFKLI